MAQIRLAIAGITLIAFLIVIGVALWYRGESMSATASAARANADAARAKANLATALDANKAQQEENATLRHQIEVNDRIVAGLASRLASIRTELLADREEVADLKDSDNDVRTYLDTSVPGPLRRVLDKRQQERPGHHKDGEAAPAVGPGQAVP